ncbi:hypothetical protein RFI_15929, partial [Reticulomyxa filosa]
MLDNSKESNWEGLLNTIKEKFHLTTNSSFLLVKKDNIDDHVDNDDDLFDLWNVLIKDKKATSYTLKMRCLEITKEGKKIEWCPKGSTDPQFYGAMEQQDWTQIFEDLKRLIGLSDSEYLENENQNNKIETADDLKSIWADRYDEHDSDKWYLRLQVNPNSLKETVASPGVEGGITAQAHREKSEEKEQDNEDSKIADSNTANLKNDSNNTKRSDKREEKKGDKTSDEDKSKKIQQSQEVNDEEDEKKETINKPIQRNEHFDIKLMLELVKKAEEAADAIKDQNVVLLLGGTGAGKSTLIHFLAGSTMENLIVDGKPHIAPVKVKNKALANVRTSAKATSETRYITAVPINLKGMGLLVDIDSVVLCDTPGFEDTSGPEVDVANGLGIIRALQNSKSVKPVVLICYTALGYRMNCVKELARTLVSIIPSIENHLTSFSYVFTKLPKEQKEYMHSLVKDTWISVKDEPDEGFKAILKDIAKKTKNVVIAPNLVSDSPDSLLERLADIKDFIKNPGEVFQPFVSESSKGAVQMQVQKHKENIWLAYQNEDYNVAKTKLDELTDLNNVLKLPTIENEYKDIVTKLTNEWNKKSENAKSMFNERIASPHLSKNDVLAYQKVVNELVSAKGLRNHLKDAICGECLIQNINQQMQHLINAIEDQKEGDESALQSHLDKISQVQACFPDFSSSYNEACQKLKKRVVKCADEARECIKKNKFMEFRKELEKIGKILILQEHLRSLIDIKKEIKDLENELLVYLNNIADEGHAVLKKVIKEESTPTKGEKEGEGEKVEIVNVRIEKLDKTAVDILKRAFPLLEEAANAFDLPYEHVGLDKSTKELVRSFVNQMIGYFEKVRQKIAYLFEKQRYQAFDEIKKFILVMDELRTIEAVKQRTGSQYFQTIEKIFDGNSNLKETVKQKLTLHLHELQQSSQEFELDLDHPELLKEARNIFTHLGNLRRLDVVIPELAPFRQKVSIPLEKSVRATLATIRQSIQNANSYLQKETFKNVKDLDSKINTIKEKLTNIEATFKSKCQPIANKIQTAEEKISHLENLKQEYGKMNSKSLLDSLFSSDNKAIKNLSAQGYKSIEAVEEDIRKEQQNLEKLSEEGAKIKESLQEEVKELKEKLDKDEQVKKEYEELLQKGMESLQSITESLKSHGFLESDVQRLINNEKELNDKIRQCERELAKLKKNSGYTFEVLNAARTAKVLQYLKECKATAFPVETTTTTTTNQSDKNGNESSNNETKEDEKKQTENRSVIPLRQETTNTLDLVEEFLRKYSIFVQSQLNSLNFIESTATLENDNDNMDMIEKVENILNQLTEVQKLQKDYPTIFTHFPQDIIELFNKRLKQTYLNLHDEMMKLAAVETSTKPLKKKIAVAKILSALDDFAQPNNKFRELFVKYQTKIYDDAIDIEPILEAIRKHEYPTIVSELLRIQQNIDDPNVKRAYGNVRASLSRFLNTLARTTLRKVFLLGENDVDLDKVTELMDNLEQIKDAQQFVIQFVDEVTQKEIERTADKTKSAIGGWMEGVLETFDASVNALNFLEAEKKIRLVRRVVHILGDYCDPVPLDSSGNNMTRKVEDNGKGETGTIISRIDKLEKKIEAKLKGILNRYKKIQLAGSTFNPYSSYPPREIYAKLGKVMSGCAMYEDTWREIEDDIIQKIRNQLEDAREKVGTLRPWEMFASVRLCKTVLNVLPDHMKSTLEGEIKECEQDLVYEMNNAEETVSEVLKTRDVNDINQFLDKCTPNQKKLVEIQVVTMARGYATGMDQKLADGNTAEALGNLKELLHLKNSIKTKPIELENQFKSTKSKFNNHFEKTQQETVTGFDALSQCNFGENTINWMEKSFDFVIQCMDLKLDLKQEASEVMPLNFEEKIKEMDRKIFYSFTSLQQKYKTNFDQNHAVNLRKVLDTVQTVGDDSPFRKKLETFKQKMKSCDIPEDPSTSSGLWTYLEAKDTLDHQLENMVQETIKEGIVNDTTKASDTERDQFFQNLKKKLIFMDQMSQWKVHVTDGNKYRQYQNQVGSEIDNIIKKVKEITNWSRSDCSNLNHYYKCFLSMQKHCIFQIIAKSQFEVIESMITERVQKLEKDASKGPNILVSCLIAMKTMSVHLFDFKDTINKRIDELLSGYKKKTNSGISIATLAAKLEEDQSGMGKMIIFEHSVFKGYSIALFNQKTKAHGIDYVLEKIEVKNEKIDTSKLKDMYEEFHTAYNTFVFSNLAKAKDDPKHLNVLANNAKLCANISNQTPGDERWDANIRNKIPGIMANIFALWTLQHAQYYHDAKGVDDQKSCLVQPHPAQVISIFRMLGIEENKTGLTNHLIQIGTGEGKSVILAITCCVLALFGFDVSCTSYSEYLSNRDFKSFEQLFDILGVIDHIHYGTFNMICERIINEGGDMRRLVENLILPGNDDEKKVDDVSRTVRSKILLIDEVDVFFNKDFYGSCYSPAVTLRHDTITKLIDFIWNNKRSFLKLKDVKQSNEYKACCNILRGWDSLLDEAIKDMLSAVQNFESHGYQVSNDKIGYKEQDGISYNIRYGYNTLFAYYHENAQNKISDESLKNNIFLSFQIGNFSYAEVPKNFYRIMGVSGTLKTLSASEQEAVEKEYHVSKYTYMPSLFGKNQLIFAEKADIFIADKDDYFIILKKEIGDRLVGKTPETKRAVLVFFETKKQLMEFYESPHFSPIKDDTIVMTEDNSFTEKGSLIKRATSSGQVGLFTRAFGRGTDFICRDEIVASNGGPHVIQTFLSEELSEEVQIKGRTARQGESGSYNIQDARNAGNFYPMFNAKRSDFFKTQYAENKKFVDYAAKEHKLGQKLIAALKRNNVAEVKGMLCEKNKGAEEAKSSRT